MEPAVPLLRNGTARQWNQPFHCYETTLQGNGTSRSIVTQRHCKAMEPAVPLLRNGTARQWNQPLHDASRYLLGTSDADQKRTDSKTRSASTRTAPTAHSVTCHAAPHAVQTLVSFSVKPRSIPDPSIWDM